MLLSHYTCHLVFYHLREGWSNFQEPTSTPPPWGSLWSTVSSVCVPGRADRVLEYELIQEWLSVNGWWELDYTFPVFLRWGNQSFPAWLGFSYQSWQLALWVTTYWLPSLPDKTYHISISVSWDCLPNKLFALGPLSQGCLLEETQTRN